MNNPTTICDQCICTLPLKWFDTPDKTGVIHDKQLNRRFCGVKCQNDYATRIVRETKSFPFSGTFKGVLN
jgi:hypothetical protein